MGLTARRGRRRRWSSYAGETSWRPEPAAPAPTAPTTRAAPPTSCGSPTSRSSGCRPARGATCPRCRLLRRQAGGLVDRGPADRGLANSSLEAACATLAPGEAPAYTRTGVPLPLARLGRDMRGERAGQEHVAKGHELRQRPCGGGSSACSSRSSTTPGTGRRRPRGVHGALDSWMRWFRSGRISQGLGWMTPDEYRASRRPV